MSYLHFRELSVTKNIKTRLWEIQNNDTGAVLGTIRFYKAWRKYVFMPLAGTVYDGSCLEEITRFVETQTSEWRVKVAAVHGGKPPSM